VIDNLDTEEVALSRERARMKTVSLVARDPIARATKPKDENKENPNPSLTQHLYHVKRPLHPWPHIAQMDIKRHVNLRRWR
jgi:hypothetical protein